MPRRKQYDYPPAPAEKHSAAGRGIVHRTLMFDECQKNDLGQFASSTVTILCGCIGCRPDLYCQGSPETGGLCKLVAQFPARPHKPKFCLFHFKEAFKAGLVTDQEFNDSVASRVRG